MRAKCDKCKSTVNLDKDPLGMIYLKGYKTICLKCLRKIPRECWSQLSVIDPLELELVRELL